MSSPCFEDVDIILRLILDPFFGNLNFVNFLWHFDSESEWIESVGTLCAQLLQFYSNSFETLQMSSPCFEDVHMVWI